jgi:hypothetical protein
VAIHEIDEDGPLALVRQRLEAAVHAIGDDIPIWDRGTARWSESVYSRLRASLVGRTSRSRASMSGSRVPCRVDVLTLVVDIDRAVSDWQPGKGGTVDRLHALTGRGWRPQDYQLLDGYRGQIERWVLAAAELLGDRQVAVALRYPCPACGEQYAYRHGGDEWVRSWALRVTEDGCSCQVCRAFWPPNQFEFLARLLGCVALPGAS